MWKIYFLTAVSLIFFAIPPASFAQSEAQAVTVATVNVYDSKITSQQGAKISLAFDISNRKGVQPGIRYGVYLSKDSSFIDGLVYPESIDLGEDETKHFELTYEAPQFLQGSYDVWVMAKSMTGLPLGFNKAGSVLLNGSGKYIGLESCYLTVVGEEGGKKYTLDQGVDISDSEEVALSCSAQNLFGSALSVSPNFEVYARNTFGEKVGGRASSIGSISFLQSEKRLMMFSMPKLEKSQAYDFVFSLEENGKLMSNRIFGHIVLRGSSGSIQNIVLDKTRYVRGDVAKISIYAVPSADMFDGSRRAGTKLSSLAFSLSVFDAQNTACSNTVLKEYDVSKGSIADTVDVPIVEDCSSPKVVTSLSNGGNILDEKTFSVSEKPTTEMFSGDRTTLFLKYAALFIAFVVVFVVLLGLFFRRRMMTLSALVLVVGCSVFAPTASKADTFVTPGGNFVYSVDGTVHTFTDQVNVVNLNKSSYSPGEALTAYGSATPSYCFNGTYAAVLLLYIQQPPYSSGTWGPRIDLVDRNGNLSNGNAVPYSVTTNVPSTPGSVAARFFGLVASTSSSIHDIPFRIVQPVCGTANNQIYSQAGPPGSTPGAICTIGNATISARYDGGGYWNGWKWTCGSSSCSATLSPGSCGSANGTTVSTAPTTNLCATGGASSVSGSGPWNWTCGGTSCSANTSSTCGSANGQTFTTQPTTNLCTSGAVAGPYYDGSSGWYWYCNNYGVYCSAYQSAASQVNCGSNATTYVSTTTAWPSTSASAFCSPGAIVGSQPTFPAAPGGAASWTCKSSNGINSLSCGAQRRWNPVLLVCPNPAPTLSVGGTTQLSARYFSGVSDTTALTCTSSGYSTVTDSATWSPTTTVSGAATVSNTSGTKGKVTAVGGGAETITATYSGVTGARTVSCAMPASGSISATSCIIPQHGNSCSSAVSWNSSDFSGTPSVSQGGTQFSANVSGSENRTVDPGNRTFTLKDSGSAFSSSASAAVGCAASSSWNGSMCECISPAVWNGSACVVCGVCDSPENHCAGESWADNCGNANACTGGTKDCRVHFREVAP